MKTGTELITEERKRQIEKEGWDSSHDDGGLATAAALQCLNKTPENFARRERHCATAKPQ